MPSSPQQFAQALAGNGPLAMPSYKPSDFYTGNMTPSTAYNGFLTPTQLTPTQAQAMGTGSGTGVPYANGSIDPYKDQSRLAYGNTMQPNPALDTPALSAITTAAGQNPSPYDFNFQPGAGFASLQNDPSMSGLAMLNFPRPDAGLTNVAPTGPVPARYSHSQRGGLAAIPSRPNPINNGPAWIKPQAGLTGQQTHQQLMAQQNKAQGGPVGSPSNFGSSYFKSAIYG